jgi:hypothetical protein
MNMRATYVSAGNVGTGHSHLMKMVSQQVLYAVLSVRSLFGVKTFFSILSS